MRGFKDFVVQINEKFMEKFGTKSGVTIYGDRRFNPKELANCRVEVLEVPLNYNGPIKKGSSLHIDSTVLMNQMYQKTGEQENINLLDRDKKLYKIEPEMIIAYVTEKGGNWKGFGDNLLATRIFEEPEPMSTIIFSPVPQKPKKVMGRVKAIILNDFLEEQNVKSNDEIYIDEYTAVDVVFGGKELVWLKNSEVLAKA